MNCSCLPQAELEQALDKMCDLLPSSVKDECSALVKQYGPTLIQLLVQEVQPDAVCAALQLCKSTSVAVKPAVTVKSEACDLCKLAVQYLDTYLKQNTTEVGCYKF